MFMAVQTEEGCALSWLCCCFLQIIPAILEAGLFLKCSVLTTPHHTHQKCPCGPRIVHSATKHCHSDLGLLIVTQETCRCKLSCSGQGRPSCRGSSVLWESVQCRKIKGFLASVNLGKILNFPDFLSTRRLPGPTPRLTGNDSW